MPYASVAEAQSRNPGIGTLSAPAKRAWTAVFNSAKAKGHDDRTAAMMAWAAAKRVRAKKATNAARISTRIVLRAG